MEIRVPSEEEFEVAVRTIEAAFGGEPEEGDLERHQKTMPRDRILCAFDDGRAVGTAASFRFELTIPGGQLAAAGVTWVGVLPSHRRRGIMSGFMQRQLVDAHERGEPLAILWASESAIYGRFGYGMSAPSLTLNAERARFRFRDDPGPRGATRLVDRDEARRLFPPVHERVRREVPGMFSIRPEWWTAWKLADPQHFRRGAGPKFFAAYEHDGATEGYAVYRLKHEWEQGMPRGQLHVIGAHSVSPAATRELWRFLFGIDLVERVKMTLFDPGSSLMLMVLDPRSLHLVVGDGLWLRLVDVEAALRARSYTGDGTVVIEVRDALCPWNASRYRVGTEVARTDAEPDLELDVADLACAYLGGFDFHALARAERARELSSGALERASALFRTSRPPYCADEF
jgi:predicted acetyltransferase